MNLYLIRTLAAVVALFIVTPVFAASKINTQLISIIRSAGYKCQEPVTEIEEELASAPQERAWIVECKNAAYKVLPLPHYSYHVEVLELPE
ncbi:MAG: hypothetical protein ACKOPC_11280 [Methylocystis sp.]